MAIMKITVSEKVNDYFDHVSNESKISKSDLVNDLLERYLDGLSFENSFDQTFKALFKKEK